MRLCTRAVKSTVSLNVLISFPGMAVRNFKGFQSLQEVECWAGHLETEMKLLSLKMYTISDNSVLAYLNTLTNECVTYGEYASCFIDTISTRQSRLRVLVADLEEGESRGYGCKASVFRSGEEARTSSWSIFVQRKGEYTWSIVDVCFSVRMIYTCFLRLRMR